MRVDCLIEAIEAARENWDHVVELVPEDKREWKPSPDAWSLKDIVAHVAWHELEMIKMIESRALEGSDWWNLPTDRRNDKIYDLYWSALLEDVLAVAKESYPRMIYALQTLSDEELNDPARIKGMPLEWKPWRLLANNTYEHYLRHVGQVHRLAAQASR
jgi:hypothetical protein